MIWFGSSTTFPTPSSYDTCNPTGVGLQQISHNRSTFFTGQSVSYKQLKLHFWLTLRIRFFWLIHKYGQNFVSIEIFSPTFSSSRKNYRCRGGGYVIILTLLPLIFLFYMSKKNHFVILSAPIQDKMSQFKSNEYLFYNHFVFCLSVISPLFVDVLVLFFQYDVTPDT